MKDFSQEMDRKMFDTLIRCSCPPVMFEGLELQEGGDIFKGADVIPRAVMDKLHEMPLEYNKLSDVFGKRPIHVPSHRPRNLNRPGGRNLSSVELEQRWHVSTSLEREAHCEFVRLVKWALTNWLAVLSARDEIDPDSHVFRVRIRDVLEPEPTPGVNFLDIPSPATVYTPPFLL